MTYYKKKKYRQYEPSYYYDKNFLTSRKWLEFRDFLIRNRGSKCECCCSQRGLNVHHKDLRPEMYTNLARVENFRVLCFRCHERIHELKKYEIPIIDPIVIEQLKLSFI